MRSVPAGGCGVIRMPVGRAPAGACGDAPEASGRGAARAGAGLARGDLVSAALGAPGLAASDVAASDASAMDLAGRDWRASGLEVRGADGWDAAGAGRIAAGARSANPVPAFELAVLMGQDAGAAAGRLADAASRAVRSVRAAVLAGVAGAGSAGAAPVLIRDVVSRGAGSGDGASCASGPGVLASLAAWSRGTGPSAAAAEVSDLGCSGCVLCGVELASLRRFGSAAGAGSDDRSGAEARAGASEPGSAAWPASPDAAPRPGVRKMTVRSCGAPFP